MIDTIDILDCYGESLGGVAHRIWVASADFVRTNISENVRSLQRNELRINGDHLMFVDCMLSENFLVEKSIGATRRRKLITELNFSIREVSARNLGFVSNARNYPLIFLIADNNGNIWVMGTHRNPAYLTNHEANTGKKHEEDSIIRLTFSANTELRTYTATMDDIPEIKTTNGSFGRGFR